MTRFLVPFILIGAAMGLFALFTNPTYQEAKKVAGEVQAYDEALTKSQELRKIRDSLISKRNTFNEDDVKKLNKILPDNVDNIRLIIDINNIASGQKLSLANVELGDVSDSSVARNPLSGGSSGDPIGSVTVGFSVNATYDEILAFLQDLERSLRIIDVVNLSFASPETAEGKTDFDLNIRTYWLH